MTSKARRRASKTGGTRTFSALVVVRPGLDRAFATVTNSGHEGVRKAVPALLQALAAHKTDAGKGSAIKKSP